MPAVDPEADRAIEIWDVNWPSFSIVRACATQWRVVALPLWDRCRILHLGLDYQGVDVVMRRFLTPAADPAIILGDVMLMEAEALAILNSGG